MTTRLYKDGNNMGIWTDAQHEHEFINEITWLFSDLIDEGWCIYPQAVDGGETLGNDWQFQLSNWIPQIVDICVHYRRLEPMGISMSHYSVGNNSPSDLVAVHSPKGKFISIHRGNK